MRENAHHVSLRDLWPRVNSFDAQLLDLRTENQRFERQPPAPAMPDLSLVMGFFGDIVHCQEISGPCVHSTLTSMMPRERFALLPSDHESRHLCLFLSP